MTNLNTFRAVRLDIFIATSRLRILRRPVGPTLYDRTQYAGPAGLGGIMRMVFYKYAEPNGSELALLITPAGTRE